MKIMNESQDLLTYDQFLLFEGSLSVLRAVISILGITGNVINIMTFKSMGVKDGLSLAMTFLAFVEMVHLVAIFSRSVSFGFYLAEYVSRFRNWFPVEPYGVYLYFGHVSRIPFTMAVLTTTFLSFARCMCVAKPMQFKDMFTIKRTTALMCGIFLFSIFSYIPILSFMLMVSQFDPKINSSRPSLWITPQREEVKRITWLIRDGALPFVCQMVVIVCVAVMAAKLKRRSRFLTSIKNNNNTIYIIFKVRDIAASITIDQQSLSSSLVEAQPNPLSPNAVSRTSSSSSLQGKDVQVIQQMIVISTTFIVCNTPEILISLAAVLVPSFDLNAGLGNLYLSLISVNYLFQSIISCVNVLIYQTYCTKFRRHCCILKHELAKQHTIRALRASGISK